MGSKLSACLGIQKYSVLDDNDALSVFEEEEEDQFEVVAVDLEVHYPENPLTI